MYSETISAHDRMLHELARNLLHNAIKPTPAGNALDVGLVADGSLARLRIADSGPGMGLAICYGIVQALGGSIALVDCTEQGQHWGLDATVNLPLVQNT